MTKTILSTLALLALLCACASLRGREPLPTAHPMELEKGRPVCTECHETRGETVSFGRFNHTPYWGDNHRQEAYQNEPLCAMCHATSFCNDCHATRVELKPSIKEQGDTYRRLPHRGDYLSRHYIDGRIDPVSCFRCHGNPKAAATCRSCHG